MRLELEEELKEVEEPRYKPIRAIHHTLRYHLQLGCVIQFYIEFDKSILEILVLVKGLVSVAKKVKLKIFRGLTDPRNVGHERILQAHALIILTLQSPGGRMTTSTTRLGLTRCSALA